MNTSFNPWHWSRMQIPSLNPWREDTPFQAEAGNWVFFYIYLRRTSRVLGTRAYIPMHTLGMDGVE